jgi:hypothetical protein
MGAKAFRVSGFEFRVGSKTGIRRVSVPVKDRRAAHTRGFEFQVEVEKRFVMRAGGPGAKREPSAEALGMIGAICERRRRGTKPHAAGLFLANFPD